MTTLQNPLARFPEIKERAAAALLLEHEQPLSKEQIEEAISGLGKAELMDKVLLTYDGTLNSAELFPLVEAVFGIDLSRVPVLHPDPELAAALEQTAAEAAAPLDSPLDSSMNSRPDFPMESPPDSLAGSSPDAALDAALDSRIESSGAMDKQLAGLPAGAGTNGAEIRKAINAVFGVNLDAIAGLEQCRISLHSKGQWIVRNDRDLVEVWTGSGDVDVRVSPTPYFMERAGLNSLPEELRGKLAGLGYSAEVSDGAERFYYAQPEGLPVPDAFKGQTMGAIIQTLREGYMAYN